MKPDHKSAKVLAEQRIIDGYQDILANAYLSLLEENKDFREALENIATYKVLTAEVTDVNVEDKSIQFTNGPTVELYDERAVIAREALAKYEMRE